MTKTTTRRRKPTITLDRPEVSRPEYEDALIESVGWLICEQNPIAADLANDTAVEEFAEIEGDNRLLWEAYRTACKAGQVSAEAVATVLRLQRQQEGLPTDDSTAFDAFAKIATGRRLAFVGDDDGLLCRAKDAAEKVREAYRNRVAAEQAIDTLHRLGMPVTGSQPEKSTALATSNRATGIAASPAGYRPPDVPRGAATIERPETLTDIGLGRRLVHESAGELLYVTNRRVWSHWDGMRWADDPSAVWPQRLAKDVADRLFDEARPVRAAMDRAGLAFILDTASRRRVDAAVAMARSEPGVEADSGEFDRDPYTLNVQNGILDLKTLELRPHDKAERLSQLAGAAFDPTANCPRWREFIDAVTCGDTDLAKFLQRSFGLALSADQSEQRLWMHWGEGSNGKGTALSVLSSVLGTYGGPVPVEVLVSRRNDSDRELHAASLVGKRLAFAQEADDGVRLSEATVKALTGSDQITARRRYQDNFQVDPTWHLHLAVNDRPIIRGNDHGIWRRVMLVPWRHTFDGSAKRDRAEVEAEFVAEASGILNWLVAGLADWKDRGLRPPEAVTGATADYRAASDSVRAWLADACVVDPAAMTGSTDLFENFSQWCKRAGFGAVSQTKFSKTLEDLGFAKSRPTSGPLRDRIVRTGLRLNCFMQTAGDGG